MSERLFDDHAPPMSIVLVHQAIRGYLLYDWAKVFGRDRHVIEKILVCGMFLIDLGEGFLEFGVQSFIVEIAGQIKKATGEPVPDIAIDALSAVSLDVLINSLAEFLIAQLGTGHAEDGKFFGEQSGASEVVKSRDVQASGEIAGRTENHHDAGISLLADAGRRRCRFGFFRCLSHPNS